MTGDAVDASARDAAIGVIGAMPEEVDALLDAMASPEEARSGPFRWHRGRIEGTAVLLAECGIGKVNAGALTQALLAAGARAVIFTGVAGAVDPELRVGDVVVSVDAVQHDVDVTPLGYALGEVPADGAVWTAASAWVELAVAAAREAAARDDAPGRVVRGRVASGDQFVASPARVAALREAFGAACAEMEGAAVAQVCAKWGRPFVIVRSISDTADQDAHTDFRAFTRLAADRAARVVRAMLRDAGADLDRLLEPGGAAGS